MKKRDELPDIGAVFWHVGNGDSNTILLGQRPDGVDLIMQVDLHHMTKSEEDDETTVSMIEQLIEILPEVDGRPYLAGFALTHPDEDHCKGFGELLEKVDIGELWLTPRGFDDYDDVPCPDAEAFGAEAERRVGKALEGDTASGNRIRVIGRADRFDQAPYSGLPESARSTAGTEVTEIDGNDLIDTFRAFIHAPFVEASDGDCNDSSLAMQVTLTGGDGTLRMMLLGDLAHNSIAEIFSNADKPADLEWDVLLAAHHCSNKALFDGDDVDGDVTDGLAGSAAEAAWIVVSSRVVPATNQPKDDPPHRKAWNEYAKIVGNDHMLCTADHGSADDPEPIEFSAAESEFYVKPKARASRATALASAVAAARPRPAPPRDRTGYGEA